MARQKGLIKLQGTLDDITFYKGNGAKGKKEHLAKTKSAIEASRIANDPAFARTRENNAEFGRAAGYGKLIRKALASPFSIVGNARAASRFTQIMRAEISKDTVNPRGQRVVTNAGLAQLFEVELNDNAKLNDIWKRKIIATRPGANVELDFLGGGTAGTINDFAVPQGATHAKFMIHTATFNFVAGVSDDVTSFESSEHAIVDLSAVSVASNASLTFLTNPDVNTGDGYVVVISVEFMQQVNGIMYSLKNDKYKAAKIVDAGVK